MIWWHWLLLGMALLAAEMMTPGGFYLLFFGLAAVAVGALTGFGLVEQGWVQWLLFSGLSIASLLLFRGPLLARIKSREPKGLDVDSLTGEIAVPLEDLAPGGSGKAELRGTTWSVRNAGQTVLIKGQRGRVKRVDGLTLWITAD
jgi:membrane protein implicated in regulation of membrane protease activity